MPSHDQRQYAPAALRNRQPIADVLRPVLPATGLVLEVASGSGEHAVHFARAFPGLIWQPSDPSRDALGSIAAWTAAGGLGNIRAPLELDAASDHWPLAEAAAVVCINMIHISPWAATLGLMQGAGGILQPGAPLFLYGPYIRTGHPIEPSNQAFDQSLRARDPRWGLRELDAVAKCAEGSGFSLGQVIEMPANNLSVVFRKNNGGKT